MALETTGAEVVDTSVNEPTGSDGIVDASASIAPIAGGQITDPEGENFDYDRWASEQGLRGEKPSGDKKNAKKNENDSNSDGDDTSDGDDNTEETEETDDQQSDDDREFEIKLKVNGEEKTVRGIQEIQRLAQLGAASNEKFQEAAGIRKEVQNLMEMLKTNPGKVFRHPNLGKTLRESVEKFMYEELQLEMMPEDRREGELAKRKLSEMEQEREYEKNAHAETEQQKLKEHYHQKYSSDIQTALEIGKLPNNAFTIRRTAMHMQHAIENGYEITYDQLANAVRTDILSEHKQLIDSTSDVESLINIIGKENVDRIRKHHIGKVRQGTESNSKVLTKQSDSQVQQNNGQRKFRSANELMDFVR